MMELSYIVIIVIRPIFKPILFAKEMTPVALSFVWGDCVTRVKGRSQCETRLLVPTARRMRQITPPPTSRSLVLEPTGRAALVLMESY